MSVKNGRKLAETVQRASCSGSVSSVPVSRVLMTSLLHPGVEHELFFRGRFAGGSARLLLLHGSLACLLVLAATDGVKGGRYNLVTCVVE